MRRRHGCGAGSESGAGRQRRRRRCRIADHSGQGHHQADQSDRRAGQQAKTFSQGIDNGELGGAIHAGASIGAGTSARTARVLIGGGASSSSCLGRRGLGRTERRRTGRRRRAGREGKALIHGGWTPQRTTEFILKTVHIIVPAPGRFCRAVSPWCGQERTTALGPIAPAAEFSSCPCRPSWLTALR